MFWEFWEFWEFQQPDQHLDAGLRSSCATLVRKQLANLKGSRGAAHEKSAAVIDIGPVIPLVW